MLVHVLGQRNEAWHKDTLRARQLELEQQLANAEEYNENLHEEITSCITSSTLTTCLEQLSYTLRMRWMRIQSWR